MKYNDKKNEIVKSFIINLTNGTIWWIPICLVIGLCTGLAGFGFDKAIEFAGEFRESHFWMLFILPVAGLLIVFLYNAAGIKNPRRTGRIVDAANNNEEVPLKVAPLIIIATTLTHLCGGSSGREGAALQMGGSISNFLGRKLKWKFFGQKDLRLITMCGMAGGFSALFGTPLTAAIFAAEVAAGHIRYSALFPCLLTSITARLTANALGGHSTIFTVTCSFNPEIFFILKLLVISVIMGLMSIIFYETLHITAGLYARFLPNQYIRIVVGALLVICLTLVLGTNDYNGAGIQVINNAFLGKASPWAFILKLIFTALTIGAGFKGGEIVPCFFVGSTLGCVIAPLLGLDPNFGAAAGLVMLFAGATNCPLAAIFLAYELYGGQGLLFFALGIAITDIISDAGSLYLTQGHAHKKTELSESPRNMFL